jgi:hypothetical protein
MDSPVTVIKLNDGNVEFWIPYWEWEMVRDHLTQAMEDYPSPE